MIYATVADLKRWLAQFDENRVIALTRNSDSAELTIEDGYRMVDGLIDSSGKVLLTDFEPPIPASVTSPSDL